MLLIVSKLTIRVYCAGQTMLPVSKNPNTEMTKPYPAILLRKTDI
jgi:hypothetical protein